MQKSRWINWAYQEEFPRINDLVQSFQGMGLRKVMEFRHNWNESVLHQFYATLEVNMEDERLTWMTSKKSFVASFQDLASLIGLDYAEMKIGKSVSDLPAT